MNRLVLEFRDKKTGEVKVVKDIKFITQKEFIEYRRKYNAYGKTVHLN